MVLKYPGQKNSLARWIISHFPLGYQKMTYLEPFFGSGSVFFKKERSSIETVNDLDCEIFNFFLQIRDNTEKLIFIINNTPWSRKEYSLSHESCDDPLEQARRFLVRAWFSIGSSSRGLKDNGMRLHIKNNTNGGFPAFYEKLPDEIRITALRLKHVPGHIVQIENKDALHLMAKYDRENVLMYLDPPYFPDTRKKKKIYKHEMTADMHAALLEKAVESKAKIIISCYDNELYQKYLKGWHSDSIAVFDEGGNKRVECLWSNFNSRQFDLFKEDAS